MTTLAPLDPLLVLGFSQHVAGARWVWLVAGLIFLTLVVILAVEVYDWLRDELELRRRIRRGEPCFSGRWALGSGGAVRARHHHRPEAQALAFRENRPNDPIEKPPPE